MTRRRDLMCEDLFECLHEPAIPVVGNGAIVSWICNCGSKEHIIGVCDCRTCTAHRASLTETKS